MSKQIELVTAVEPTCIIRVNIATEEVTYEFFHANTAARMSLLNLALDMAKAALLRGGHDEPDANRAA